LFDPAAADVGEPPPPRHALSADLLLLPGVALDDHWEPLETAAEPLLEAILATVEADQWDWSAAFAAHAAAHDHVATQRVLEVLEARRPHGVDVESLRSQRDRQVKECRTALWASIADSN